VTNMGMKEQQAATVQQQQQQQQEGTDITITILTSSSSSMRMIETALITQPRGGMVGLTTAMLMQARGRSTTVGAVQACCTPTVRTTMNTPAASEPAAVGVPSSGRGCLGAVREREQGVRSRPLGNGGGGMGRGLLWRLLLTMH
jgi:hypothetical protein